eukprot:364938-Chlamydomonas_euryale.AAC.29
MLHQPRYYQAGAGNSCVVVVVVVHVRWKSITSRRQEHRQLFQGKAAVPVQQHSRAAALEHSRAIAFYCATTTRPASRKGPSSAPTAVLRASASRGAPASFGANSAEPATTMFAPACAAARTVSAFTPPSTWMSARGKCLRSVATFSKTCGSIAWPPKPGSTVMHNTRSTSPASSSAKATSAGVAGASATPARMPAARTLFASSVTRPTLQPNTSAWNVSWLAPADAMRPTYRPGSDTAKCTSRKADGPSAARSAARAGGPSVKLST